MKKIHILTMLLLVIWILFGLLANPFLDRSFAQSAPKKPTATPITKSPPPFVSHPGVIDGTLFTIDQLRAAYNVQPLIDAGFDGKGQTIALVEKGSFAKSDVDSYVKRNHLPKPNIETILVGSARSKTLPADIEATADIELVLAIAPNATVLVYETPAAVDAFPQIVADQRAQIASMSLAVCEEVVNFNGAFAALHRLIVPSAVPHLSVFVGSGDWGAFGCAQQTDPKTLKRVSSSVAKKLSVSALASDPSVTAVGGTILHFKNGKYSSEEVWNTYEVKGSTGGGLSIYWPLPDYQTDYYQRDANPDRMRQVPDVAASAENYGLVLYGSLGHVTGTSLSTPLWAAGTLLVDQYLASKLDNPGALLIAPEMLYQLKTAYTAGKVSLAPFHEVTKGDNRKYLAGSGYNLATGLGTPNFYNIAQGAEQLYSDLLNDIEPTDTGLYLDRGNNYYRQGKLDQALADFNMAVAIDPVAPNAYSSRARVFYDQSKFDLAQADYNMAITIDPKYFFAYAGLGEVYDAQHNVAQALKAYHTYLDLAGKDADRKVIDRVHTLESQSTPTATAP